MPGVREQVDGPQQRRLAVVEDRIEADLGQGCHVNLVAQLKALAGIHLDLSQPDQARRHARQALDLRRATGQCLAGPAAWSRWAGRCAAGGRDSRCSPSAARR